MTNGSYSYSFFVIVVAVVVVAAAYVVAVDDGYWMLDHISMTKKR